MTKAQRDYMDQKNRELRIYGHYIVTMEEMENLTAAIRKEESMAKKKVSKKKTTKKKTSKKKTSKK
jgi:hypothetical protein